MADLSRHVAVLSNPLVRNGAMYISVFIEDWSRDLCFFFPLNSIDNKKLLFHLMWKFSGDPGLEIKAEVMADIMATSPNELRLSDWNFCDRR
jgi:hypothetical protein